MGGGGSAIIVKLSIFINKYVRMFPRFNKTVSVVVWLRAHLNEGLSRHIDYASISPSLH